MIKKDFKNYINRFGNKVTPHIKSLEIYDLLCNQYDSSMVLEIGPSTLYNNTDIYLGKANERALMLYNELFKNGDNVYLIVDNQSDAYMKENPERKRNIDVVMHFISRHMDKYDFNVKTSYGTFKRSIVETKSDLLDISGLLNSIISSGVLATYNLASSVYLLNFSTATSYYLCDDRWLYISSDNHECLHTIYNKYKDWILKNTLKIVI